MLRSIQDTGSQQLPAQLIENVMAMLRSSELYNPGSNSLTEDPEALGFMDGLMEVRAAAIFGLFYLLGSFYGHSHDFTFDNAQLKN